MGKDGRRKNPPHGTRERYYSRTDPCRCAACREANAAYQRDRTAELRRAALPVGDVELVDDDGHVIGVQSPLFGVDG